MGEGFRPIFEGVHRGVGRDAVLGPVGRGAVLVVAIHGLLIVGALVAEQAAVALALGRVLGTENGLVVVADFVAQVTEQGAVGLAHLGADLLAVRVVGFGEVEGDDAVAV